MMRFCGGFRGGEILRADASCLARTRGARAHAPEEAMNEKSVEPTNPESIRGLRLGFMDQGLSSPPCSIGGGCQQLNSLSILLEQLFKLPALVKMTNTEPFAAWSIVTGDATADETGVVRSFLEAIGSLPIVALATQDGYSRNDVSCPAWPSG